METKRTQQSKWPGYETDKENKRRASHAAAALAVFLRVTGVDLEDAVCDLLVDLMHWCDGHGQNFDAELQRGRGHYEDEA